MNINKLNLAFTSHSNKVGRSSCVKLFFAGFGQEVNALTFILNHTINRMMIAKDPWILDDLKNCCDIYAITNYEESDLLAPQISTNAPLEQFTSGVTIDNSSLEVLSLSGVEITVNSSVPASPSNLFEPDEYSSKSEAEMDLLQRIIDTYDQVEVIGWSFGVRAARSLIERLSIPQGKITFATAIGGTIAAVDRVYGIDPRVYNLTLKRLNVQTYETFKRNMCLPINARKDEFDTALEIYSLFSQVSPVISSQEQLEALKQELMCLPRFPLTKAFDSAIFSNNTGEDPLGHCRGLPKLVYNQALICEHDAIFDPKAQINYWQSYKDELTCLGIKKFEALQFAMPHFHPQAILNALTTAPHQAD